jgi:hypothetical protein
MTSLTALKIVCVQIGFTPQSYTRMLIRVSGGDWAECEFIVRQAHNDLREV